MNNQLVWEIVGYAGSALVLVSLLMTSIVKLRIINAIGCIVFCIYAFVINSIPTAIMNAALFVIDIVFLVKILSSKANFSYVSTDADNPVVTHFCEHFSEDICLYFDKSDISKADRVYVIFDNETVAGVLAGILQGDNLRIIIDYTTKEYRDCKVAIFIYEKLANTFRTLIYSGNNEKHISYCMKMGYSKVGNEYVKTLQ